MNGKVILLCGKIACGKSFYALMLKKQRRAVILSCDEIMLCLFGSDAGEKHDDYARRTQKYLFDKSLEIIESGCDVILDWGFWQKNDRDFARKFYKSRNIACELHYIDTNDALWKSNIKKRNDEVLQGKTKAYYMDDGLAKKLDSLFEIPDKSEVDFWYENKKSDN